MIHLSDFCYMRQGKCIRPLRADEIDVLAPIEQKNGQSRTALLLLHGFSSSPAVYRTLLPELHRRYDTLIGPCLPGHATCLADFSTVCAHEWEKMVYSTCEHLIQTHQHVDVMGLSLGGVLAYQLSHVFPLRHLYLLAPAFQLRLNLKWTLRSARFLAACGLKTLSHCAGDLHLAQHSELTYQRLPLHAVIEILSFIQRQSPPSLTCPTDIFLGQFDQVVDSQAIAQLFKSQTHATLHWLMHSAHILPLDGDQDVILDAIAKYDYNV